MGHALSHFVCCLTVRGVLASLMACNEVAKSGNFPLKCCIYSRKYLLYAAVNSILCLCVLSSIFAESLQLSLLHFSHVRVGFMLCCADFQRDEKQIFEGHHRPPDCPFPLEEQFCFSPRGSPLCRQSHQAQHNQTSHPLTFSGSAALFGGVAAFSWAHAALSS